MTDQLWWITNKNKERGPANVGVPPFQDGEGRTVVYNQAFEGGFRSNMDVLFQGPTTFDLYPASGEGVYAAGDFRLGEVPTGTAAGPAAVTINPRNEADNSLLVQGPQPVWPSDSPNFDRDIIRLNRALVRDGLWLTDNTVQPERSIRYPGAAGARPDSSWGAKTTGTGG